MNETQTAQNQATRGDRRMRPEAQRIAIAEACGWKNCFHDSAGTFRGHKNDCVWILPDYLSDLNAMHSAEETLTDEEMHDMNESIYSDTSIKRVWRATAEERAKHFLKIKGLWKE